MTDRLTSLDAVQAACWEQLRLAVRDRAHAWRTPVLATADGDQPDARTVVLRGVDAALRTLTIYSDARAHKVVQLKQQPLGVLVMWSPALRWQLRLRTRLSVQTEGLAVASTWARLKLSPAAQDYLSPLAPGAALPALNASQTVNDPAPQGALAILTAQVEALDWLELHDAGHRRASFDAQGQRWLQP